MLVVPQLAPGSSEPITTSHSELGLLLQLIRLSSLEVHCEVKVILQAKLDRSCGRKGLNITALFKKDMQMGKSHLSRAATSPGWTRSRLAFIANATNTPQ